MEWGKGETRGFSLEGFRKRRQGKCKKGKEKGRWTKKVASGKKHKGEYKREDTKGRAEAKNITKTAKVRVFERSGFKKKKKKNFGTTQDNLWKHG
jgi:hypothetical protein